MRKRKLAFGTNSISIVVIVLGLTAVLNFFGAHNQQEIDFTKNQVHSFSDQSTKVMAGLNDDLKAEFYGDFSTKGSFQPLFENYEKLSPRFKLEFIDPTKEPARAKVAGITKMNTLLLSYQGRTIKVNDLNEEKITNAILKIEREKKSTVCMLVGHGEASSEDITQSGMQVLKQALEDQSYDVKEFSFPQHGPIPETCSAILMMGVHGAFFADEVKTLSTYLNQGGRAIIATDAVINKKDELAKDFHDLLLTWGIDIKSGLVVDPETNKMGVDASLVMVDMYNPHHPITKDSITPSYFPFVRPVDFTPTVPAGFQTTPLIKTNEGAWSESDINSFIKGAAKFNEGVDIKGPLSLGVATSGKMNKAKGSRETRLVVFGSSQFVDNQYSRIGGNLDLFMNAASWILQDENLISIRAHQDENGKVELSEKEGVLIFWILVVIIPFATALLGTLIWLQRKRM